MRLFVSSFNWLRSENGDRKAAASGAPCCYEVGRGGFGRSHLQTETAVVIVSKR